MTIAVMDVGFSNVDSGPVFDSIRNSGGILAVWFLWVEEAMYIRAEVTVPWCFHVWPVISPELLSVRRPRHPIGFSRTEDGSSETIGEEYNWIRAAEYADSVGADLLPPRLVANLFDIPEQNHSYSMLNGRIGAPMSIAATMAARKGIFVLTAAGNGVAAAAGSTLLCRLMPTAFLFGWRSWYLRRMPLSVR